jgi:hypothetical protein
MTKKIKKIQAFFKKGLDGAVDRMKSLDSKKSKGSFAFWAEWHCMEYIHWEAVREHWETLNKSLAKLIAEGKTEDEIVKWIEDCRNQFIQVVLTQTPQHSTNQLGNMIFAERIEVSRRFGSDSLNSDSLEYLLADLRREDRYKEGAT